MALTSDDIWGAQTSDQFWNRGNSNPIRTVQSGENQYMTSGNTSDGWNSPVLSYVNGPNDAEEIARKKKEYLDSLNGGNGSVLDQNSNFYQASDRGQPIAIPSAVPLASKTPDFHPPMTDAINLGVGDFKQFGRGTPNASGVPILSRVPNPALDDV